MVNRPGLATALVVAGAHLLGCGADAPVLAPVIDVPPVEAAAYPYAELDAVLLSVARTGGGDLTQLRFERGQALELTGVAFGDDLVVHLSGEFGGFEVSYGRTCAFNLREREPPPTPHLYFSRTLLWAPGPMPGTPGRVGGVAYAARGGAVFLGGGPQIDAVDRFDADAGQFVTIGATIAARVGATVAPLGDGRALLIGGQQGPDAVDFFEVVNPFVGANQVQTVPAPTLRLVDHAAVALTDGSALVIGGRQQAAAGAPLVTTGETWQFTVGDGGVPAPRAVATLVTARAQHTATLLPDFGDAVLVVGGRDAVTLAPVAAAELYEPVRREWLAPAGLQLNVPRYGHVAVPLPHGRVLIVGGFDAAGVPVEQMELYSPVTQSFELIADPLPADAGLLDMTATPLPDGRVLLAGGRRTPGGAPLATAYIVRLDPNGIVGSVDVVLTDGLDAARAGHSAVRLCDGTVLLVGGTMDTAAPGSERYNPPSQLRR